MSVELFQPLVKSITFAARATENSIYWIQVAKTDWDRISSQIRSSTCAIEYFSEIVKVNAKNNSIRPEKRQNDNISTIN